MRLKEQKPLLPGEWLAYPTGAEGDSPDGLTVLLHKYRRTSDVEPTEQRFFGVHDTFASPPVPGTIPVMPESQEGHASAHRRSAGRG